MTADEKKAFGEQINALSPELQSQFKKLLTTKTQAIAETVRKAQAILDEQAKATEVPRAAASATDAAVAALGTQLGPDLDFLAPILAPAMEALVSEQVQKAIEPYKAAHEAAAVEAQTTVAETLSKGFAARHPDFEKFMPKITELSMKLQPNGMDPDEYLDTLYNLASAPAKAGTETRKLIDAQAASDRAAASASSVPAVPQSRVTAKDEGLLSFREAGEAARRELAASGRA